MSYLLRFGFVKRTLLSLAVAAMMAGHPAMAATFSIDLVDGDWVNPVPGTVTIANSGANGGLSTARWGTSLTTGGQSGYDFFSRVTPFNADSDGTPFALGRFTHQNFPIGSPASWLDTIDLQLAIEDLGIFDIDTTFNIDHTETPNVNGGPPGDNDLVTILNPVVNQQFSHNAQDYFFNLIGFSQDGGNTIKNSFSTIEGQANSATLYARITEERVSVPEPSSMLLIGIGMAAYVGTRLKRQGK